LELVCGVLAAFATSIPLARVIGPSKLGYFNYVAWLTSLSGVIGGLGMAGATRKYMAEYLNRGQSGLARAVFSATLALQTIATVAVTLLGLLVVLTVADPAYRTISVFLVLSMVPGMVVTIPASANMAAESMRANTIASLAGYLVQIVSVVLSLKLKWDLLGVAVGVLAFRFADCMIKLWSAWGWISKLPREPLPVAIRRKLINFSSYNMVLLILNMVVWDRSDIIFLKLFSKDLAQLSFYSVAINLTDKIRLLPNAVGTGMGANIQAQYGRNASRLPQITSAALWYTFLCGLPLMAGMAAMAAPVITLLYGHAYVPAIPVLVVAALFCIPKCYLPAWNLLEALEKQRFLVVWMSSCGVLNIVLDIALIPRYGALGAAMANGIAQFVAIAGVILKAQIVCNIRFRVASAARASLAAVLMIATVVAVSKLWSGWAFLPLEVLLGAGVFLVTLRVTSAFDSQDRERLLSLQRLVPAPFRGMFGQSVLFLIPEGGA
jgi:O-antigen/teichoic acid export membrane protein